MFLSLTLITNTSKSNETTTNPLKIQLNQQNLKQSELIKNSNSITKNIVKQSLHKKPEHALREVIIRSSPEIIGFGEFHTVEGHNQKVKSALAHFIKMLDLLKGYINDMILETWITNGNCGQVEKQATESIEETIQRPESTESEIIQLINSLKQKNISPHILTITCNEYESLLDKNKEMDYEKLLKMITDLTLKKTKQFFGRNRTVATYGGAIHNSLYPQKDDINYSYGPILKKISKNKYVEVDLIVPEYVEPDAEFIKNELWYPYFKKFKSKSKTLLLEVKPFSYAIIFPWTDDKKLLRINR